MACTGLTLIDPIFARLFYNFVGVDFPLSQVLTYGLIDAILACLAVWDRRHGRPAVFLKMLPVFVVEQIPAFFVYTLPSWRSFAIWYGSLSLP